MSLNRTLDRLFAEVRREAKRNPAFAERLDAVLRLHASGRDLAPAPRSEAPEAVPGGGLNATPSETPAADPPSSPPLPNPLGVLQRQGERALRDMLSAPEVTLSALRALVDEHNLDPSGRAADADLAALVEHIVAHSTRRAERDKKLFDY